MSKALNDTEWRGKLNLFRSADYKQACEAEADLIQDRAEREEELEQARNERDGLRSQVETLQAALEARAESVQIVMRRDEHGNVAITKLSINGAATPDAQEASYKERLINALKAYAVLLRVVREAKELVCAGKSVEARELLNYAVQCADDTAPDAEADPCESCPYKSDDCADGCTDALAAQRRRKALAATPDAQEVSCVGD